MSERRAHEHACFIFVCSDCIICFKIETHTQAWYSNNKCIGMLVAEMFVAEYI